MMSELLEVFDAYTTEEEFQALEKAIFEAKRQKREPTKPKPGRRGMHSAEEIEGAITVCESAYTNGEYQPLADLYQMLLEAGVDWLPFIKGRIALGLATNKALGPALKIAVESYKKYPEEPDAYLAMAILMVETDSPRQAKKWFDLAVLAADKKTYSMEKLERLITDQIKETISVSTLIASAFTKPFIVEKFRDQAKDPFVDSEAFTSIVEKIQQNPTVDNVLEIREHSSKFRILATSFFLNPSYDSVNPVVAMSEDELVLCQRETGGAFAIMSAVPFEKIASHLTLIELSRMQQTCKPLFMRFNSDSVWRAFHHQNSLGDTYGLPTQLMMMKTGQKLVKHYHCCLRLMDCMKRALETGPKPRCYFASLEDSSQIFDILKRHTTQSGFSDAKMAFISHIVDLITMDSTLEVIDSMAGHLFNMACLMLFLGDTDELFIAPDVLQLISTLVLRSTMVRQIAGLSGIITMIASLAAAGLQTEALGAMAAVQASEYMAQFNIRAIAPSRATRVVLAPTVADLNLNGLYHTFLDTGSPTGENSEKGIMNLVFDEDGYVQGNGVDTLGEFTIESNEPFNTQLGSIQWIQKYKKATLLFVGTIHPYGFGGSVSEYNPHSPDPLNFGSWFICADAIRSDSDLWEAHKARIAAEAAKIRRTSSQLPWAVQPSQNDQVISMVQLIASQVFLLFSPGVSTQAMLMLANTIPTRDLPEEAFASADNIQRGPGETQEKFQMRRMLFVNGLAGLMEGRQICCGIYKEKLLSDASILETDGDSPKGIETRAWWTRLFGIHVFDILSMDENTLPTYLRNIASGMEAEANANESIISNRFEDDNVAQDVFSGSVRSHRKNSSSISTTTFLALSSIGIAVIAIGAFFAGRLLAPKND